MKLLSYLICCFNGFLFLFLSASFEVIVSTKKKKHNDTAVKTIPPHNSQFCVERITCKPYFLALA